MPPLYIPERGDIAWMTLDPQSGREQAGRRPVIILSLARYNRAAGLAVVCPITSRVKNYPYEELIPDGSPVAGVVLADQIKSLDWTTRRAEFIGRFSAEFVDAVLFKVDSLFI